MIQNRASERLQFKLIELCMQGRQDSLRPNCFRRIRANNLADAWTPELAFNVLLLANYAIPFWKRLQKTLSDGELLIGPLMLCRTHKVHHQ
ncbi:hypothetical protein WJ17_17340 [Burkholderia vietnamiensis]|nr:hypothetical protein WJ17_17340 [Burkholderia vietnamiensis]